MKNHPDGFDDVFLYQNQSRQTGVSVIQIESPCMSERKPFAHARQKTKLVPNGYIVSDY